MRIIRNAPIVAAVLCACAGGDGLGPASTASPYYGTASVGDADDDGGSSEGEREDGDSSGAVDPSAPDEPPPDEPPPPDPTGAPADDGANDGPGDDGAQPPAPGDCCTATGLPGCAADPAIEACVCDFAEFCCTEGWDEDCVFIVGECAEACPGQMPPDGGTDGGGMQGDCCAPTGMPGCSDPEIAGCVCSQDAFCCLVEWDDVCAELAFECGC